ncbi:ABC transporter ATP-binding protein [Gordonia sp. SL306]|uniref:ABC transporter ATP-binding protein n=1 Tax=Gordonia sp. SL306 TaxID=2995145 RepID=UPI00226D6F63|nr:ABC transporter ATP-binding protein [Gordonia sp. SL306]WAC56705.1 ABC transporter ATP-binding protein [Gordonia sp. SL306]
MDLIVDVEGLSKSFGRTRALNGLTLAVEPGRVHGFLGPNGAGKSTTIRTVLGLIRADAGRIRLFGRDPWKDAVALHRRLAYVPGDVALWPDLTGGECIDILASGGAGLDDARRSEFVERFGLDVTKKVDEYSKGNRQKVALIAALASNAELLILDEPTSGLDPLMEEVFQCAVRERVSQGVTVLLSSHILAEVEALSDAVTIIRDGATVRTGGLDELRKGSRTRVLARTRRRPEQLSEIDGVTGLSTTAGDDGIVDVRFDVGAQSLEPALGAVLSAGVASLTVRPPSLDELFLSSYSATTVDGEADGTDVAP